MRSPFPYFLNDERKNSFLIVGISIFMVVFMVSFHPGHFTQLPKITIVSILTFLVLFLNIILLPRLFPAFFDTPNWTFGRHVLFTGWQLVIIGLAVAASYNFFGFYPGNNYQQTLLHISPNVLIYGSVPITLVTMLLKNRMLQENLENALKANRELDKIRYLKEADHKNGSTSIIVYSDTSETLKLTMQDLLYIEANDNYSTFHWKSGSQVEKKMLRINLKNVEKQLNNSFAIRCHRSYIVNINAIDTVSGNTNGYKLSMMNGGLSIPLSRSKGKEVTEKIRQLRSVMEIY